MAEWRARGRRSSGGQPSSPRENQRGGSGSWGSRGGSYTANRNRRSPSPVWPSRRAETGRDSAYFSVRSADIRSRRSDGGDGPRRPGEPVRWPAGNPRRTESGLRRRDSVDESVGRTRDVSVDEIRRAEGERSPRAADDIRRPGNAHSLASQQPRSSDGGYELADRYHRSFGSGSRMQVRGIVGSLRRGSPPRRRPHDSPPRRRPDDSPPRRRPDDSPPRRRPDDSPPRRRPDDSPPRRRPDDSPPRRRPDDSPPRRRPDDSPPRRRPDDSPPRRRPDGSPPRRRPDSPPRRRPDDSPLRRDVDIDTLGGDSSYAADDLPRPSVEERVVRRTEDRHIWSQSDRQVRNVAAAERFHERPHRTDEYERRIESPTRPPPSLQHQARERRVDSPADPLVGDTWQARESVPGIGPKLGRIDQRHASDDYRDRRMDGATDAGHVYRVERAGRTGDVDDFEPNYIPEKKIRLDPSDLGPHHPDEYIAVDRRLMTDSNAGVRSSRERRAPFDKEWRSPKHDVDVFRDRSREQSTEDVKRSYSRQSPRSDSRHTDKAGVRTDRFERDSMHSLPAIAVQQDSMRDSMRADGRYRSMSPTTAAPRSPLTGDNDFKIPDVYEDADTVRDLDFDASGRATRNAELDDRNVPRSSLANRHDSDTIKRTGRNHRDVRPASPQRKRRAGIDLREEVLGGRRYRGMEVAVVQELASHSAPDRVGDFPPDAPLNSRAARPELPGFARPPPKRSRSSSLGRAAIHRTAPVASREVPTSATVGATRPKYVIERMLSEEDRIRSFTRGLRPDDFASNEEIDRSIQQLWTGFCRRMLDVGAVPLKHLKLEYLNAYFDVLKSTYPHFAEYYRVCKQQLLGSSDRYSPVEKKRVHSVETNRSRHLPPASSKTFEHGRAALLLKRAKEQKLAVYRSSASTKTAELESTFASVPNRDVRLARQHAAAAASLPRRPFSSAAASAATTRHGNIRPATSNVVRLVAGRGNDSRNGEPAIAKNPASRSSKMQPPSAQDGGTTSEPIDSGRTSTVSGSAAGHATGGKSTRPSAKESEPQPSDNAPDRLQGTSLVAVADAAAATSGKAVFDDPFMKFLHTTLTAMIVIGELQRQQISGRLTAHHSKSLADERAKMEERMRTEMGHRLIKLARYIQHGDLNSAREALSISENVLNTVANLDPVVIRTIACTPLLH